MPLSPRVPLFFQLPLGVCLYFRVCLYFLKYSNAFSAFVLNTIFPSFIAQIQLKILFYTYQVHFVQIVLTKMYKLFSETAFHGRNHFQKDKPWLLQLFWFIAFLTAASVASVLFYYQIEMYKSKHMATEYRIITAKAMQLPTLVVCTKYSKKATKML